MGLAGKAFDFISDEQWCAACERMVPVNTVHGCSLSQPRTILAASQSGNYPVATGKCSQCGSFIYDGTDHICKYDFEPSLRDRFAMAALTGMMSKPTIADCRDKAILALRDGRCDAGSEEAEVSARIEQIKQRLKTDADFEVHARDDMEFLLAALLAERERCAEIADAGKTPPHTITDRFDMGYERACEDIAAKIRSGE